MNIVATSEVVADSPRNALGGTRRDAGVKLCRALCLALAGAVFWALFAPAAGHAALIAADSPEWDQFTDAATLSGEVKIESDEDATVAAAVLLWRAMHEDLDRSLERWAVLWGDHEADAPELEPVDGDSLEDETRDFMTGVGEAAAVAAYFRKLEGGRYGSRTPTAGNSLGRARPYSAPRAQAIPTSKPAPKPASGSAPRPAMRSGVPNNSASAGSARPQASPPPARRPQPNRFGSAGLNSSAPRLPGKTHQPSGIGAGANIQQSVAKAPPQVSAPSSNGYSSFSGGVGFTDTGIRGWNSGGLNGMASSLSISAGFTNSYSSVGLHNATLYTGSLITSPGNGTLGLAGPTFNTYGIVLPSNELSGPAAINPTALNASVPEPSSWMLLLLGSVVMTLAAMIRRRQRAACGA